MDSEMTQWGEVIVAKTDVSLAHRTHTVDLISVSCLLTSTHVRWNVHTLSPSLPLSESVCMSV